MKLLLLILLPIECKYCIFGILTVDHVVHFIAERSCALHMR